MHIPPQCSILTKNKSSPDGPGCEIQPKAAQFSLLAAAAALPTRATPLGRPAPERGRPRTALQQPQQN